MRLTQTDDGPGEKKVGKEKGCTTGLEPCRARVAGSDNRTEEREKEREKERGRACTRIKR